MSTVYACCKRGHDVNNTPNTVHYAETHALGVLWLENNGGGYIFNHLHNFGYTVKAKGSK